MANFVAADATAGRILYAARSDLTFAEVQLNWAQPDVVFIETAVPIGDPDAWRLVEGAVVPRLSMTPSVSATTIEADGLEEAVISGLPDPCDVSMSGAVTLAPTEVTGGTITITSTSVGPISLKVVQAPTYLPWEVIINAV